MYTLTANGDSVSEFDTVEPTQFNDELSSDFEPTELIETDEQESVSDQVRDQNREKYQGLLSRNFESLGEAHGYINRLPLGDKTQLKAYADELFEKGKLVADSDTLFSIHDVSELLAENLPEIDENLEPLVDDLMRGWLDGSINANSRSIGKMLQKLRMLKWRVEDVQWMPKWDVGVVMNGWAERFKGLVKSGELPSAPWRELESLGEAHGYINRLPLGDKTQLKADADELFEKGKLVADSDTLFCIHDVSELLHEGVPEVAENLGPLVDDLMRGWLDGSINANSRSIGKMLQKLRMLKWRVEDVQWMPKWDVGVVMNGWVERLKGLVKSDEVDEERDLEIAALQ
ncbi:MAG: hypothetical protein AAFN77_02965 [Planctomycetota bacterium]